MRCCLDFSDDEYSVSNSGLVTQISKIPLSALQRTGVFYCMVSYESVSVSGKGWALFSASCNSGNSCPSGFSGRGGSAISGRRSSGLGVGCTFLSGVCCCTSGDAGEVTGGSSVGVSISGTSGCTGSVCISAGTSGTATVPVSGVASLPCTGRVPCD